MRALSFRIARFWTQREPISSEYMGKVYQRLDFFGREWEGLDMKPMLCPAGGQMTYTGTLFDYAGDKELYTCTCPQGQHSMEIKFEW